MSELELRYQTRDSKKILSKIQFSEYYGNFT